MKIIVNEDHIKAFLRKEFRWLYNGYPTKMNERQIDFLKEELIVEVDQV